MFGRCIIFASGNLKSPLAKRQLRLFPDARIDKSARHKVALSEERTLQCDSNNCELRHKNLAMLNNQG